MAVKPRSRYPAENEMSVPAILDEFVRRHGIIMARDGDVIPLDIFIRKTSQSTGATKCRKCWDEHNQGTTDPNCETCFGVGFEGGYEKITAKVRILSSARLIELSELGLVLNYQPQAWIVGDKPLLSNGDVLVRANNFRYEIMDWTPSETQGRVTRQTFTIKFLPPKENPSQYRLA
jgi:hypothetical protein